MRKIALLAVAALLTATSAMAAVGIKTTKHDLSSTGSTSFKQAGANQVCIFCHTPHNANTTAANLLWNRNNPTGASVKFYNSTNLVSYGITPANLPNTSTSLFCMSCHDGVTALGAITYKGSSGVVLDAPITGTANLGDLTNDHPIGFSYATAVASTNHTGALVASPTYSVFFDGTTKNLECGSCHAVHDATYGKFLRTYINGSALCLDCHVK